MTCRTCLLFTVSCCQPDTLAPGLQSTLDLYFVQSAVLCLAWASKVQSPPSPSFSSPVFKKQPVPVLVVRQGESIGQPEHVAFLVGPARAIRCTDMEQAVRVEGLKGSFCYSCTVPCGPSVFLWLFLHLLHLQSCSPLFVHTFGQAKLLPLQSHVFPAAIGIRVPSCLSCGCLSSKAVLWDSCAIVKIGCFMQKFCKIFWLSVVKGRILFHP